MLVIFHFIMHTVKIISVCVHIFPKPHINVLYIFQMKTKRELFYILRKTKRQWCLISFFVAINIFNETEEATLFDIIFCFTVMHVRSLSYIFAAINMFT